MMEGVRITTDTAIKKAMTIHMNGSTYKFNKCKDGLYYMGIREAGKDSNNNNI